jgi:RNAse (barnase) inhibitor barstar
MAVFSNDATTWSRLDYMLLRDGGVSLYYSADVLAEDLAWLREERYQVHEFDCMAWRTWDDFHTDIAGALGFPNYYGRNLAALNDCMGDVEVPDEGGMVLLLRGVESVMVPGKFLSAILGVLARASRDNLPFGRRLLVLLHSRDPRIQLEPVGCVSCAGRRREPSRRLSSAQLNDSST